VAQGGRCIDDGESTVGFLEDEVVDELSVPSEYLRTDPTRAELDVIAFQHRQVALHVPHGGRLHVVVK
jgi:hypothetical protein